MSGTSSLGVGIADTGNTDPYSVTLTPPSAGLLAVVLVYGRATLTEPPTVSCPGGTNGVTSFASTTVGGATMAALGDAGASVASIHVANALTTGTSSMTLSIAYGADPGTGAGGAVVWVAGMTKTGSTAALQFAGTDNNLTSGGTPACTFGSAVQTGNTVLGLVGNNTNPATITFPSGFTELVDNGFATPTSGAEVAAKDTGFTGTTVTWGSTSGSRGVAIAVELDASSGSTYAVTGTVAGVSAVAGTVSTIEQVTGSVAGVSAVSGAVTVIPGAGGSPYAVTGTVAGVSGVALSAGLIAKVTGTVAAISAVHGAVAIPGPALVRDNVKVEISTLPAYSGSDSPTDVSGKVNMPDGQSFTRGRADEFSTVEPGEASLTLDYLTAPAIPSSAWVQITEAAPDGSGLTRVFRGKVDSQNVTWDPLGKIAKLELGLVDRLALLQRREMGSMLRAEILADAPLAYYPLDDPAGSRQAADASGNPAPPAVSSGNGAAVTFAGGTEPADGQPAAVFTAAGKQLVVSDSPSIFPSTAWTIEAFVNAPSWSGTVLNVTSDAGELLVLTFVGGVVEFIGVSSVIVGPTLSDTLTHHLAVAYSGGLTKLYVDGVLVGSAADATASGSFNTSTIGFLDATLSHIAFYGTALSAGRVAEHAMGLTAFAGETTADRATRIAGYAGLAPAEYSFAGAHLMAGQSILGVDALDALREVAVVENSVVYVDGSGVLTMPDSHQRTLAATTGAAAVTLLLSQLEDDLKIALKDKQYLENQVTGTRDGGLVQLLQDDSSIDDNDVYPKDLGTISAVDDDTVLALVAQELWGHQLPADRVSTLTVDLLTLANDPANYALVIALIGLELGDRIQVTGMWATAPFTVADAIVEGIGRNRDEDSWTVTFNVSPAAIYQRVILDDPVFCLDAGYYYGY